MPPFCVIVVSNNFLKKLLTYRAIVDSYNFIFYKLYHMVITYY
ncbi:CRPV-287 [Crowpox virus]|nr:CRPV-287 [Crowpox virus]